MAAANCAGGGDVAGECYCMNAEATVPAVAHALLDSALGQKWRAASVQRIEDASNCVLHLALPGEHYALRIPVLDTRITQVDRRSECLALQRVARRGIAPEMVACDADSGVLITHWIAGEVWTMQRAREPDAIGRVARLLKELHAVDLPRGVRDIDLAKIIEGYLEQIRGAASELSMWCLRHREAALRRLDDVVSADGVLCHCDVHHRNLLEGTRLLLIDWEYAGRADALFDLASYASYHELDGEQTRLLLDSYGVPTEAARSFEDWRWLFEYVWLLWLLATAAPTPQAGTTESMTRLVGKLLARE
jgi:thiamine kinase-like enzyme